MHLHGRTLITITLATALFNATVMAGSPPVQDPQKAVAVTVPVKVTVTISRFQGEKRVSSLPYILSVNVPPLNPGRDTGRASLRMGTRVPIVGPASAKEATPTVNYQDVGTSIDCGVSPVDGGGFRLDVTIDESSVTDDAAGKSVVQVGRPSFRSFRTTDSLMLRDGQSKELTSVPDKLTGEIVKVDVALAVVK